MTTETEAPVAAEATDTATTEAQAASQTEAETADEAALEVAEPGESSTEDKAEEDPKAEVERLKRKLQRRIDKLTADRGGRDEQIRQLRAELEAAKRQVESDEPAKKPEVDPMELAKQIRAIEKTTEATTKVWREASTKFPDFKEKVAELVEEIGPQLNARGEPTPLMEAVLDSDSAGDILYYLGENPEVAAELVGLTPARIGRRIERIETELKAKAKPKHSAAPRPLAPVKPAAVTSVPNPEKMTDKQWAEYRRQAR